MEGKLFSQNFLTQGIVETKPWQTITASEFDTFKQSLENIFAPYDATSQLNEANTEAEIIVKILDLLGWQDLTQRQVQANSKGRQDVPDFLLFDTIESKQKALKETKADKQYLHGISVLEAKKWCRPLDRGDATDKLDSGTPSNQILRYLSSVEIASNRKITWGILTNGAVWRLYWQGARSRSEEFFDIDLSAALKIAGVDLSLFDSDPEHALKLFYCLFRREAFLPQNWDTEQRTFHQYAFNEARLYEEKVSTDLGSRVFKTIFPQLANALAQGDPEAALNSAQYLSELREATLILLYRLLFLFYAEDRNLLPVRDTRYDDYALRKIRTGIAERRDANDTFSASASRYWQHLGDLFRIISKGDTSIGMPAYNGGLFEETRAPILSRTRVPDSLFAPLLDDLSRRADLLRAWINYRDLSVQHLGGIYERLLEYSLQVEKGVIVARPASFARKTSGSYYTHDGLVKLIIKETVAPLIAEQLALFNAQITSWAKKPTINPTDWKLLDNLDPAAAILDLKICDPAMGSGHFLVSLVDYLADEILETIATAELEIAAQPWAKDITNAWASPLVARIKDIRSRILTAAHKANWTVTEAQLDDRHIVRRMILKRVVYGVDKNPMAVELAKVALWLHTFTVGAPLSFLDHHLRCGDSLFGGKVSDISQELGKFVGMFHQEDLARVERASATMEAIGNLTDIDIAEAHYSKALMETATEGLLPLHRTLDFLQAKRWAGNPVGKVKDTADWDELSMAQKYQRGWSQLLAQEFGENLLESVEFLAKRKGRLPTPREQQAHSIMQMALARAEQEHFLHWELAFPTVWQGGQGGFDAIIGNPPWDRMKLQEVEWFAERRPQIALASKAADRKKLITELQKTNDPLWQDYQHAQESAEIASKIARSCGDYPLLSGGDINLYSLFVERASWLVKPTGIVGLLTPSGIAADKGAAEFFSSLSKTGRLGVLFDFENRKTFFPDIHASFKFCALVFGGAQRQFEVARCAFYVHEISELDAPTKILKLQAADFSAVNPNTGAAPIFRTRRDADITTAIYRRQPVLVDRRNESKTNAPLKVWPVRYCTMFHMTNDSHLFKKRDDLEKQGWYPVGGNHWKNGEAEAVPLYVGRMVYNYDHRASHVTTNEENLHNAALSANLSAEQKADIDSYPTPQYWVATSDIANDEQREWAIGFRDIARATDMRTMIAAIVPTVAAGNTLPLVLSDNVDYAEWAPLLLANFNSLAFDYIARQKTQSTHLNWYIVEQLPLIKPEQFGALLSHQTKSRQTIADFIRGEVLHLSYTAHDLAPFARDLGYVKDGKVGAPFVWDETDRLHRQCRLDALFFNLYGIHRDDASYMLDQFPIVREQDIKAHGRYLTRDLILAYMNAVAAGDFTTVISLDGFSITPHDIAFEEQLELGREFMRDYRDTFKALAK
ncbi:MAG: Eco57I restriction-modification methylase domain-containing protein [Methylotenera sp.]|uniref:Eco57I restriction-modification methylase domain-containing protein n=1 Tax=Methylotenera sp. TaxID=2051956 RepID=UPI002487F698|nr:Eco57I restriction-modification methylase domain-containing protein [Methylotenera sp.]MDI1309175.1 Eco57I restriction-modification methylase domain-containing protein [Methylotenera sp.]